MFQVLFGKKIIREPENVPKEPEAIPEEGLNGKQNRVFSNDDTRRLLRQSASSVMEGMNLSRTEQELTGDWPPGPDGGLRLSGNPEIYRTLKEMYERCWKEGEPHPEFDRCFQPGSPDYEELAAVFLARMVEQFDSTTLPSMEYTDADSIRREGPAVLKRGYEAMVLSRCVQGKLRERVNRCLKESKGEEAGEIVNQWKRLDLLTGVRNATADVLEFYTTDAFETGELPGNPEDGIREKLEHCSSSLCHMNASCFKTIAGRKLEEVPPGIVSYACRGGDHRAFYHTDQKELMDFMSGRREGLTIKHRDDYLRTRSRAQSEAACSGKTRRTIEELQMTEMNGADIRKKSAGGTKKRAAVQDGKRL